MRRSAHFVVNNLTVAMILFGCAADPTSNNPLRDHYRAKARFYERELEEARYWSDEREIERLEAVTGTARRNEFASDCGLSGIVVYDLLLGLDLCRPQ